MVFRISSEQFYLKYQLMVQNRPHLNVHWYVDNSNILNMYIPTDFGYMYYYATSAKNIQPLIKSMIKKDGEILGIVDDDTGKEAKSMRDKLDELKSLILPRSFNK